MDIRNWEVELRLTFEEHLDLRIVVLALGPPIALFLLRYVFLA